MHSREVRERLEEMQDSRHYAIYVAELSNGQIAGWIGVYVFRSIETGSCAEINGSVVDEGIRSRGIGKLLLSAIEEWGQGIGCEAISVRSSATRQQAHRFYRNNGYEFVKIQKAFRKIL